MSQDNPGVLHDATNSWNGYIHQGKIALYYAIKKITDLLEAATDRKTGEDALKTYFWEVEYTEDFSIGRIRPDGMLYYDTIHQVKDRQDTALSKYESAIQGLAVNMVRHPEVETAYLHVTQKVSTVKKDKPFSDSVKEMLEKTDWIDKQELDAQSIADPAKKQEELDRLKKDRTGLSKICGNQQKLAKIQKYPYVIDGNTQEYCPKDKAKDLVLESLKNFYRISDPGKDYKQDDNFIEKSYKNLVEKLNEYVTERAIESEKDKERTEDEKKKRKRHLKLDKLYDWLTSKEIEDMGEAYYRCQIKENFIEYLDKLCDNCEMEKCATCQVSSFKARLGGMSPAELSVFLRKTNPNVSGDITLKQYPRYLQESGIESPFWNGLRRITQKPEDLQNSTAVEYLGSDNRMYILTTLAVNASSDDEDDDELAKRETEKKIKTICTEIYKNQRESKVDLSGKCLLSKNIKVTSVRDRALTVRPSDFCGSKNNITNPGETSIIKVSHFRKEYMRKEHEEA